MSKDKYKRKKEHAEQKKNNESAKAAFVKPEKVTPESQAPNATKRTEKSTNGKQPVRSVLMGWISEKSSFTDWCLVIFTGVLAWVAVDQFKIMSGQLDEMQKQTRLSLRPYIGVAGFEVKHLWGDATGHVQFSPVSTPKTTGLDYIVGIKDFGPIPGTNYTSGIRVFIGGEEQPNTEPLVSTPFTLYPGPEQAISGRVGTEHYLSIMHDKQVQLLLDITIGYDAPSGHYQECDEYRFDPEINGFSELGPCPNRRGPRL